MEIDLNNYSMYYLNSNLNRLPRNNLLRFFQVTIKLK
jgi:hypothetical protein